MNIQTFSPKRHKSRKPTFLAKVKKPFAKYGFLGFNTILVASVAFFLISARSSKHSSATTQNSQAVSSTDPVAVLDQISSADIAVNIAQAARLPEVDQVRNQADSRNTLISIPVSDDVVVAKPQIITDATTGTQSRKDIAEYVTVEGDNITTIAQKFALSAESLKWSNALSTETVAVGTKLVLPPKNRTGLVYKASANDTIEKLAEKYKTTADKIIAFNDLEITRALPTNEYIFIPDGEKPPEPKVSTYTYSGGTSSGGTSIQFKATFGGNGYAFGNCTWYAAERRAQLGRPIPSNLGNARTWLANARGAGMATGEAPQAGAIVWFDPSRNNISGYGHVAMVESVNADGSVNISGMNDYFGGGGGWGRVSYYTFSAADVSKLMFIY